MTLPLRPPRPRPTPHERGSAYVAVLGLSMLVTTIGLGAMLAIRSQRRASDLQNDEGEARAGARGAVDLGARSLALSATWRSTYSNNTYTAARTFGRGTIAFKLVDELDGNLSDNPLEPVRLYGVGRVGAAARVVSVGLSPTGPTIDALGIAAYSAGNLSLGGDAWASGGPVACAGQAVVPLLNTFNGDVECGSLFSLGNINGTVSNGSPARAMPSPKLYNTYKAMAVAIPFGSILGSNIQKKLLSAGSNPYGSPSALGIYAIDVPASSTLTINQSRLAATLVVNLASGATLTISGPNTWDPPTDSLPTLIVRSTGSGTLNIQGSTWPLTEQNTGINFNPASTPYFGISNTTSTDTYPNEVRGLVHVIGASVATNFSAGAVLRGSCISEGPISLSSGATLIADPGLYTTPPQGYFTPTGLLVQPASWRREQDN